jgi:hypothetical protein
MDQQLLPLNENDLSFSSLVDDEPNIELAWRLEQALRECLTRGADIEAVKLLCYASGINYKTVIGA